MDANVKEAVPYFRVVDMKASTAFYVDGLGFEIDKRWDDRGVLRWCSMKLGGATIMLQQFRRKGQDAWAPDGRVGEGVTIYFTCDDAIAVWREAHRQGPGRLPARGGQRHVGDWTGRSRRLPHRVPEPDGCGRG